MRTKEQYIERLKGMKHNLYFNGETIGRDHEVVLPSLNVMGATFDAAQEPEMVDLCTATSHLTGEKINRFCHVHQSTDDLHKKQDMTRKLCQGVGFCIQRCMGVDALNAVNAVSFEADKVKPGETNYHQNFLKWLERFQKEDLVATCAQTDVKGERMKRPIEQNDPDSYVHVVERREDGIVVRGCKVHITQAATADEIIVVPTRALGPDESDYAVAFAVPGDHEGVKQVIHVHNPRERKEYKRGFDPGYIDSYVIFDDVFVPWDRVFLCGETQHGGICALLFALFHRHSYSGCKPAVGDILMGMASLAAEVNGIEKTSHVREKLSELITIAELGYAAGFTASAKGQPTVFMPGMGQVPYGPGGFIPDSIYANVGRCLSGESVYHEQEILCDIAGGMPATFPYEEELLNEEIKPFMEKYLKRNPDIPVEDQIKFWMFLSEITCSSYGGSLAMGGFHGGGSPIMEQIAITSQYDMNKRKKIVRNLAGMSAPVKKKKKG
jgi:aromatic ring hydroxylase